MKIFVEIEVEPAEIPLATELFAALKAFANQGVKPRNPEDTLKKLLVRFLDPAAHPDAITSDVVKLLELGELDEMAAALYAAFVDVAFQQLPAPTPNSAVAQSALPLFFGLLPRLPDSFKMRLRDSLIPYVVKHLTAKRPLDCNRVEFFSHAEGFAALVSFEFVSITGAVATMTSLLLKPETRAAAVTMLGKTVELCLPILQSDKCDAGRLNELRLALQKVTEEMFRYDVAYIESNMGWSAAAPAPVPVPVPVPVPAAAVPPRSPPPAPLPAAAPVSPVAAPAAVGVMATRTLAASRSLTGHRNTIFGLCYDEPRQQLVSAGKDGLVLVWAPDGSLKQTLSLSKHYACALDVNQRARLLLLSGVPKDTGVPPALVAYSHDGKAWAPRGALEKPGKLVSCVKTLPSTSGASLFVTGESAKSPAVGAGAHAVVLYDVAQNSAFERLQPVTAYDEHTDIITSLQQCPVAEGLFFSGSRDGSIKLWDARQPRSASNFRAAKGIGHDMMVTCLDAQGFFLMSGSLDKTVCVWDLRGVRAPSGISAPLEKRLVDESAVLKVALCPELTAAAAVSTLAGLNLVQWSGGSVQPITPFADQRALGRYHDLCWNPASDTLFAAGDEHRVDVYSLVPPPEPAHE